MRYTFVDGSGCLMDWTIMCRIMNDIVTKPLFNKNFKFGDNKVRLIGFKFV